MSIAAIPAADINQAAQDFKIASDPTRLAIIMLLNEAEMNVSTIRDRLKIEHTTASYQLNLLKLPGVVECYRHGKFVVYSLTEKGRAIVAVFNSVAF